MKYQDNQVSLRDEYLMEKSRSLKFWGFDLRRIGFLRLLFLSFWVILHLPKNNWSRKHQGQHQASRLGIKYELILKCLVQSMLNISMTCSAIIVAPSSNTFDEIS